MFRVRSSFKGKIQVRAPLQAVRNFFSNLTNFTDMLGGVESVRRETGGIARWTIATETPVGHVRFFSGARDFAHADMIEWSPAPNERENLLRYTLKFEEQNSADGDRCLRIRLSCAASARGIFIPAWG